MKRFIYSSILLVLILSSCRNTESSQFIPEGRSEVCFTSQVSYLPQSRAIDNYWEVNDKIGVYMKQAGLQLSASSVIDESSNIEYITTLGNGNFLASQQPIYFPEDDSKVDFIAYYPHTNLANPFIYPVDLSDQSDLPAIDLLYSDNVKDAERQSEAINLAFTHQLSRLTIRINATSGELYPLTLKLDKIPVKADFHLADGSFTYSSDQEEIVYLNTTHNGSNAVSEALLLPSEEPKDITLLVEYNGKTYFKVLTFTSLKSGKNYTFTLSLDGQIIDDEADYERYTETPVITPAMFEDDDLLYVIHDMPNIKYPGTNVAVRNYSMLFSKDLRFAYWVAYPLYNACTGSSGRTNAWAYDPVIPIAYQANLSSGFGNSYDRGHQIPSGDRTSDKETNRTTFYYSNMTPQLGKGMNQGIWANLENEVRSWMSDTDTVFVVTGAMPPVDGNIVRYKEMAVPEYYFKALARKRNGDTEFTTIAFVLENIYYSNTNFMNYAISVKELEEMTEFEFFPSISKNIKATLDKSKWN